jgi:hypothetical protein
MGRNGMNCDDDHRHREEIDVVAVRQPLDDERGSERGQRAARSRFEISVQCKQRQRHPSRHQDLQMPDLPKTGGREREDRARDHRRIFTSGQPPGQLPRSDAGERERRDEREVVNHEWPAAQPRDRRHRHADTEQMF